VSFVVIFGTVSFRVVPVVRVVLLLNWRCRLTQVNVYNYGRKTMVVVVVASSICQSLCLFVTVVRCAKTAEPIEMLFGLWTARKRVSCLEKEIMQGTMLDARRRGRPRTAWMDNDKTWTGLNQNDRWQR